jgi:hypothetical protein
MTIVETILTPILANISHTDKWQRDFLIELFKTLFSRQGRFNFENLTRYSIIPTMRFLDDLYFKK